MIPGLPESQQMVTVLIQRLQTTVDQLIEKQQRQDPLTQPQWIANAWQPIRQKLPQTAAQLEQTVRSASSSLKEYTEKLQEQLNAVTTRLQNYTPKPVPPQSSTSNASFNSGPATMAALASALQASSNTNTPPASTVVPPPAPAPPLQQLLQQQLLQTASVQATAPRPAPVASTTNNNASTQALMQAMMIQQQQMQQVQQLSQMQQQLANAKTGTNAALVQQLAQQILLQQQQQQQQNMLLLSVLANQTNVAAPVVQPVAAPTLASTAAPLYRVSSPQSTTPPALLSVSTPLNPVSIPSPASTSVHPPQPPSQPQPEKRPQYDVEAPLVQRSLSESDLIMMRKLCDSTRELPLLFEQVLAIIRQGPKATQAQQVLDRLHKANQHMAQQLNARMNDIYFFMPHQFINLIHFLVTYLKLLHSRVPSNSPAHADVRGRVALLLPTIENLLKAFESLSKQRASANNANSSVATILSIPAATTTTPPAAPVLTTPSVPLNAPKKRPRKTDVVATPPDSSKPFTPTSTASVSAPKPLGYGAAQLAKALVESRQKPAPQLKAIKERMLRASDGYGISVVLSTESERRHAAALSQNTQSSSSQIILEEWLDWSPKLQAASW